MKRSLSAASIPMWDKLLDGVLVQIMCRRRYEGTGLWWFVNVRDARMPQKPVQRTEDEIGFPVSREGERGVLYPSCE